MRIHLLILVILTACGEPMAPQYATDMFVRPVRDARPVRVDMRRLSDAALPRDMGPPTGSRDESRSTFFPGEYVPYGTCPDAVEYGGQTTQVNPMPPNGGTLRVTSPAAYDWSSHSYKLCRRSRRRPANSKRRPGCHRRDRCRRVRHKRFSWSRQARPFGLRTGKRP